MWVGVRDQQGWWKIHQLAATFLLPGNYFLTESVRWSAGGRGALWASRLDKLNTLN